MNIKGFTEWNHFEEVSGKLLIDGYDIEELVKIFDTPCYFYSKKSIFKMYENVKDCFDDFDILYSFKSNPSMAICNELKKMGAGADVASENELKLAINMGFEPKKIIYTSPAKSRENIEYAVESEILAINVESIRELEILEEVAKEKGKRINAILRVNPGNVGLDLKEVMAGEGSKFGMSMEKIFESNDKFNSLENVKLCGIHVYTASQILEEEVIAQNFKRTLECAISIQQNCGLEMKLIDFGAGLGIPNDISENSLDLKNLKKYIKDILNEYSGLLSDTEFKVELGRYLVSASGLFVSKVLYVKGSYLIIDGGMNNFFRPLFMGFNHPTTVLNRMNKPGSKKYDIGGPICSPIDVIAEELLLPEAYPGDLIGFFNAGAYGWSMSLQNFLSFSSCREIIIDKENGNRIIREKSDVEDIMRLQRL